MTDKGVDTGTEGERERQTDREMERAGSQSKVAQITVCTKTDGDGNLQLKAHFSSVRTTQAKTMKKRRL